MTISSASSEKAGQPLQTQIVRNSLDRDYGKEAEGRDRQEIRTQERHTSKTELLMTRALLELQNVQNKRVIRNHRE